MKSIDHVVTATAWRVSLPTLRANGVTLRELRLSDAPSLLAFLNTEEVTRFISPPPTTVAGFERFIEWTHRERAAGHYVCFGIVPDGYDQAVGLFQVRQLNASFQTAEWGFVMGSNFWGTGLFIESARAVVTFTFTAIGVDRLEARSCVQNGRGNGALQKLGATREGVLRQSFLRNTEYHDQVLWAILAADWHQ
jgi:RimJ/RimL family protein N-acetyltransferase